MNYDHLNKRNSFRNEFYIVKGGFVSRQTPATSCWSCCYHLLLNFIDKFTAKGIFCTLCNKKGRGHFSPIYEFKSPLHPLPYRILVYYALLTTESPNQVRFTIVFPEIRPPPPKPYQILLYHTILTLDSDPVFTIVFPNIRALPLPINGIRSGYNHFPRHTSFCPHHKEFYHPPPLPRQWNQIRFTIVFPDIRVFLPTIANLSLSRPPTNGIRSGSQYFSRSDMRHTPNLHLSHPPNNGIGSGSQSFSPTIELFPPLYHFLVYHAPLTREPGPVHRIT